MGSESGVPVAPYEIRQRLKEKGFDVGKRIVKKLGSTRPCVELRENQSLKKHKY